MSKDVSAWIAVVLSILATLNLMLLIVVAYWKLGLIESYFSKSQLVADARRVWCGRDPIARISRLSMFALALTMSGLLEKKGLVELREVRNVPRNLRRWVVMPIITSGLVFFAGMAFYLLEKK